MTVSQGCLQRCFGVYRLKVETAGQSGPHGGPEVNFTGIVNCEAFRTAVLEQRHKYVESGSARDDGLGIQSSRAEDPMQISMLTEIRDVLVRIESSKQTVPL